MRDPPQFFLPIIMDGPDISKLFAETDCLNAVHNLKDIVRNLRFSKGEDTYQKYLKKYLPKLVGYEEFDEFIGDLEDKDMAKALKKPKVVEGVEAEAKEIVSPEIEIAEKKPKKRGPKKSK